MAAFTALMTDVLGLSLTIGTGVGATTLTLGGIALGVTILGAGVGFFKKLGGRR